jgi:hypothetical protein
MSLYLDLRATVTGTVPVGDADDIQVLLYPPDPNAAVDAKIFPAQAGLGDLHQHIDGKDVLLVVHGFNWSMLFGAQRLSEWEPWMQLPGTAALVGVLWPGDSNWAHGLDYPAEDHVGYTCGGLLAQYINKNFTGVASLSLASHSLGARVVLETARRLDSTFLPIAQLILMAGAIDDDCLTQEYSATADNVSRITVLYSKQDDVLEWLFPLGNPVAGIFDHTHPYFRGALGRYGPKQPRSNVPGTAALPPAWKFGHSSYVTSLWPPPMGQSGAFPVNGNFPPANAPPPSQASNWQQAWMAAYVASRLRP